MKSPGPKKLKTHRKGPPADPSFATAFKSFVGYLEGTQKAKHTISSYRFDLAAFSRFLTTARGSTEIRLSELGKDELDAFQFYLKSLGQKTNTRRRKLITVKKFLGYLANRNQITEVSGHAALRILPPAKIERIPFTVDSKALSEACFRLPAQSSIDARNSILLRTLAETGCQVSEITRVRFTDYCNGSENAQAAAQGVLQQYGLRIPGKHARTLPISHELYEAVQKLHTDPPQKPESFVFRGFNKYGPLTGPISVRGVELLVRHSAAALGFPSLVPRTFRHSAVLYWHSQGLTLAEIQARLGLKTNYAFRAYEALFRSKT